MIRINLLPQKKKGRRTDEAGQRAMLIGIGSIAAVAAAMFFLVHQPLQEKVDSAGKINATMKKKVKDLKNETKDFEEIESAFKSAQAQQDAIARLRSARATPAWLLHELATIMTKDRNPTMTKEMAKKVREDPNRGWVQGWDPKHVWISQFKENGGRFKITGGAQADSDMTQLVARLSASVYFKDVLPQSGKEVRGKGGISYYNFLITGRVVY